MKGKEKSNTSMNKLEKLIYDQLSSNQPKDQYYIPEKKFDPQDTTQSFYKMFSRHASSQIVLKHGHKVFRLSRHEQDLTFFCLSLLQFQAKFPVRIFSIDDVKKAQSPASDEVVEKDMWIETQFYICSMTSNGQYPNKEKLFQYKVFNFFKDQLIIKLKEFKKLWINWDYMTKEEYTDEKVVNKFKEEVIKWANQRFKEICERS